MKKIYFIFGASSEIAKNLLDKIQLKNEVICFSSKKIIKRQARVEYIKTNYSSASIEKILKKKIDRKNKNIFLFFNAISEKKAFYQLKEKEINKIININFTTPIRTTNVIIRNHYLKNITCIYFSSSRALHVDRGISLYGSTKIGMESFVKSIALEYGNLGLNFRVVSLGLLEGGLEKTISESTRNSIFKRSAIKKNIKIDELHKIIEFIIKDKTGNGSTIKCDNGYF
jgi:short-subunit dehydrogenase